MSPVPHPGPATMMYDCRSDHGDQPGAAAGRALTSGSPGRRRAVWPRTVHGILVGAAANRCAIAGPLRCNVQAHNRAVQERATGVCPAGSVFYRVRAQPLLGGWFRACGGLARSWLRRLSTLCGRAERPAGPGLVHRGDASSPYASLSFIAPLIEAGIDASISTVGTTATCGCSARRHRAVDVREGPHRQDGGTGRLHPRRRR
jgi:transposase InsO family protein